MECARQTQSSNDECESIVGGACRALLRFHLLQSIIRFAIFFPSENLNCKSHFLNRECSFAFIQRYFLPVTIFLILKSQLYAGHCQRDEHAHCYKLATVHVAPSWMHILPIRKA